MTLWGPYDSPPLVVDTNVIVAGACRREGSLAYRLLLGVLEERSPIVLTQSIALEYEEVLLRPAVRSMTGLGRKRSLDLVLALIARSRKVQVRISWRPNLGDEDDNKFVEAALHAGATIVTYNARHFVAPELAPIGWSVLSPQQFFVRLG